MNSVETAPLTLDTRIFNLIRAEEDRQRRGIELIASENYVSEHVLKAMGSCLTNKYAEGLPKKRYYGGCSIIDEIEQLAIDRLKQLFGAVWANVQPHSGTQANFAVISAIAKPGDTILSFNLSHGGHLSHGAPVSIIGKIYNIVHYGVRKDDFLIDYDELAEKAYKYNPKLIIVGASSYARDWDYKKIREIADSIGAFILADIAHPAGLIAKGFLNNPLPWCHFIPATTHKTLRGPRGGVILMGKDFENPFGIKTPSGKPRMMSSIIDSAVFPGSQGGPLEHVIAAKAVTFHEDLQLSYKKYIEQVIKNARTMAQEFINLGYHVLTGGTDNHLFLIDLRSKNLTGKEVEELLEKCDITVNKNMIPFDDKPPLITSGIRIGTPAITTRGIKEEEAVQIVHFIDEIIKRRSDEQFLKKIKEKINSMMYEYPLFAW